MGKVRDLTGQRFGRLIALSYEIRPNGKSGTCAFWKCKCDCGRYKDVRSTHLISKSIRSCGCLHREQLISRISIHQMTRKRFYRIWQNMKTRTSNVNSPNYAGYGGRGISICTRWISFEIFKGDMYASYLKHVEKFGEKDTTIERNNNDKEYSPENCRWATRLEQSLNKTNTKRYLIRGEYLTLSEIAHNYNLHIETVFSRIKNGWDAERIISPPMFEVKNR